MKARSRLLAKDHFSSGIQLALSVPIAPGWSNPGCWPAHRHYEGRGAARRLRTDGRDKE